MLRVLGTVITQSGRLWVVDSCSETDVFEGVPRDDEDDDERFGDSNELMDGDGEFCLWTQIRYSDRSIDFSASGSVPTFITDSSASSDYLTLYSKNAGWTLLSTLMIVVLRTYFHLVNLLGNFGFNQRHV